jgi:hypothetical protein
VVGVSADSMDISRGIGERDGEAFSDRPKTGVSDDPGFDPPLSFDASGRGKYTGSGSSAALVAHGVFHFLLPPGWFKAPTMA